MNPCSKGFSNRVYLEVKASESGMDVGTEIEALWDANSDDTLEFNAQQKRDSIELSILLATAVEPSGNWGPGIIYVYDYDCWLHTNTWLPIEDSN